MKIYIKFKNIHISKIYYTLCWFVYIIDDWRRRTWVISERKIGTKKNLVVYSLLLEDNINLKNIPDLSSTGFSNSILTTLNYIFIINKDETLFTMILNSNSTKNEDRFYSILPHTKYSKYVKDIDNWKINSMTDVILKLLEIVDLDDKITYLINRSIFFQRNFLPSFATNPKGFTISNAVYTYKNIYIYDIILKNKVLFIETNYYKIIKSCDLNMNQNFPYKQIGLTINDEIEIIEIYLGLGFKNCFSSLNLYSIIIKGNMIKNKWIAIKSNEKTVYEEDFKIKKEEVKTFNIY